MAEEAESSLHGTIHFEQLQQPGRQPRHIPDQTRLADPYSVQTREFLDALNLTNLDDAFEWTVNATKYVDSQQAGSGTAFALLPAENATGNYVKVVQRVPVKIVFDEAPHVSLGPGMSVVPKVRVR